MDNGEVSGTQNAPQSHLPVGANCPELPASYQLVSDDSTSRMSRDHGFGLFWTTFVVHWDSQCQLDVEKTGKSRAWQVEDGTVLWISRDVFDHVRPSRLVPWQTRRVVDNEAEVLTALQNAITVRP